MLRRALLVSTLILASTVGFANSAKAADAEIEIPFDATVAANCSFGTVTSGTLGLNAAGNALDSKATGGTSGSVPLSCTGAATVKVIAPTDATIAPATNPTSTANKGFISVASKSTDSDDTTGVSLAPTDFTTAAIVTVDMTANVASGSSFTAGAYKYKVKVVATPGT